jgi:hypothetical protein
MGRVVAISRHIPTSSKAHRTFTTFSGRFCCIRFSIRSTARESRLMKDAVPIVVHISRQQGQPVLDVGQDLRLNQAVTFSSPGF